MTVPVFLNMSRSCVVGEGGGLNRSRVDTDPGSVRVQVSAAQPTNGRPCQAGQGPVEREGPQTLSSF